MLICNPQIARTFPNVNIMAGMPAFFLSILRSEDGRIHLRTEQNRNAEAHENARYVSTRKQITGIMEAHGGQIIGYYGHAVILYDASNVSGSFRAVRRSFLLSSFLPSPERRHLARPNNPLIEEASPRDVCRVYTGRPAILIHREFLRPIASKSIPFNENVETLIIIIDLQMKIIGVSNFSDSGG